MYSPKKLNKELLIGKYVLVEDLHAVCVQKNIATVGTKNDPYENNDDGDNVADDEEQASTSKKTRKKQDKEDIMQGFVFLDFETVEEHATHTMAIAHNAKGFDSHFILQYLDDDGVPLKVVTKETT
uniref:DNA-directed DNA polymerase n=1 Tax=Romanomermis culicivorax TaxID=13658 RepID=A0A915HYK0_ROMCU